MNGNSVKRHLATYISSVVTNNCRITGIHVSTCMSSSKLLLLNVYIPCNYGDDESAIECMECLRDLNAVMVESDAVNAVSAGDFNCNTESKFFPLLDSFMQDNGLIMSDVLRCLLLIRTLVMTVSDARGLITRVFAIAR